MSTNQSTDTVVMISPNDFHYNAETANTNRFQHQEPTANHELICQQAMDEFNAAVATLRKHDIRVIVLASRSDVKTPDAVFPNNWFSTHKIHDKKIMVLYPMYTANRRAERQAHALKAALKNSQISFDHELDLSDLEQQNLALEGTGSIVFDHVRHIAYAALSPRTHPAALTAFVEKMHYSLCMFTSLDEAGNPIYHTNVVLSIGTHFAVIHADSIKNEKERAAVLNNLQQSGKTIISLDEKQMNNMAGNILELKSTHGQAKIVMSKTAYHAFSSSQKKQLASFGEIVPINIDTIEKVGGGSARCMLAEIFS